MGEKTEQPTPRKLEEAIKRGQIAHSAEVQTSIVLLGGLLAMVFTGRETWALMAGAMTQVLGHLHDTPLGINSLPSHALNASLLFLRCAGPIVLAIMLGGLLAGGLQTQFNTSSDALAPNWERLNPVEGLKHVFSMRSAVPTLLGLLKLAFVILLTYSTVAAILKDPIFTSVVSMNRLIEFMADASLKILTRVLLVIMVIAAADYTYQFWQTHRDLMMTKEEVKEEAKSSEGNPMIKSGRRRLRSKSKRKMLEDVPKADVVVTNPTHIAIALRYDSKTMKAPKILAKGIRLNAERIREIARQHQVPLVENKPLAQLMFKYGKVGGEIPAQLYAAVAEVLAWVYRVNRYRYYAEANNSPTAALIGK